MNTFKCHRCRCEFPRQASHNNLNICKDCWKSDIKGAEQYFRDGRWKQLPRFMSEATDGTIKELDPRG